MSTRQAIEKDIVQIIDSKDRKNGYDVGTMDIRTEIKFYEANETIGIKDGKNFNNANILCQKKTEEKKKEDGDELEREEGEIVSESDGDGDVDCNDNGKGDGNGKGNGNGNGNNTDVEVNCVDDIRDKKYKKDDGVTLNGDVGTSVVGIGVHIGDADGSFDETKVAPKDSIQQKRITEIVSPCVDDVIDLSVSQEDINSICAGEDFLKGDHDKGGELTVFTNSLTLTNPLYDEIFKQIHEEKEEDPDDIEDGEIRSPVIVSNYIEISLVEEKLSENSEDNEILIKKEQQQSVISELSDGSDGEIVDDIGASITTNVKTFEKDDTTENENISKNEKDGQYNNVEAFLKDITAEISKQFEVNVDVENNECINKSIKENVLTVESVDVEKSKSFNAEFIDKNSNFQQVLQTKNKDTLLSNTDEADKINLKSITLKNNKACTSLLTFGNNVDINNKSIRKIPDEVENEIIKAAKNVNTYIRNQTLVESNNVLNENSAEGDVVKLNSFQNVEKVSIDSIPLVIVIATQTVKTFNSNKPIDNQLNSKSLDINQSSMSHQLSTNIVFDEDKKKRYETIFKIPDSKKPREAIDKLLNLENDDIYRNIDPKLLIAAPIQKPFNPNWASTSKAACSSTTVTNDAKLLSNTSVSNISDNSKDVPPPFGPNWLFASPEQAPPYFSNIYQSPSPRLYRKEQGLKTFGHREKFFTRRPKPYDKPQSETIIREQEKTHLKYMLPQPYCPYTTPARIPRYMITLYDEQGRMRRTGADICDCGNENCIGCWYNCFQCGSPKCGLSCRCNRQIYPDAWILKQAKRTYH